MNILVLNASPRRNGTISQAASRFMEGVEDSVAGDFSEDIRVDVVNVADLKFAPCTGCMQCRIHPVVLYQGHGQSRQPCGCAPGYSPEGRFA